MYRALLYPLIGAGLLMACSRRLPAPPVVVSPPLAVEGSAQPDPDETLFPFEEDGESLATVVYFPLDSDRTPDAATLGAALEHLRRSGGSVRLDGHACEIGTDEYNFALSERRAGSVRAYLIAGGVGPERITTTAWGEELPASKDLSRNRRVEIVIGRTE